MTILYLHDYDGRQSAHKADYLRSLEHNVIAPRIDYTASRNQEALFNSMLMIAQNNDVAMIIGEGLGGHLAFHIADALGVPALLFNPELARQRVNIPIAEVYTYETRKTIVQWGNVAYQSENREFINQIGDERNCSIINRDASADWQMIVREEMHRLLFEFEIA